jgi:hypothetical protein
MPRKSNTIEVTAWPPLREGHPYLAKVRSTKLQKASDRLHVTFENLASGQLGRRHEQHLSATAHPGCKTARFFEACGITVGPVGSTLSVDEVVGAQLVIRFRGLGPDGTEDFGFEKAPTRPATTPVDPSSEKSEEETHESERPEEETQEPERSEERTHEPESHADEYPHDSPLPSAYWRRQEE